MPAEIARRPFYRPELDALRFFAFIGVFLYHVILPDQIAAAPHFFAQFPMLAGPVIAIHNIGEIGLPLFFLLSAYLIAELLMREQEQSGTVHLGPFYIRRILRIWPLYYFALALALGNAFYRHSPDQIFFVGACAVFLGNWSNLVHPIPWGNPFGPLWSISVEEQFYLVFPVILKALRKVTPLAIGITTIALSLICTLIVGQDKVQYDNAWYNTGVQALFLGCGITLAALFHKRKNHINGRVRVAMIAIGFALLYGPAQHYDTPFGDPVTSAFALLIKFSLFAIACCLFFTAVHSCKVRFPKWMITLGQMSYGLYVFHTFSKYVLEIVLLHAHLDIHLIDVISSFMTFGLAALSYRFIEKPFLKLKKRFTFVTSRDEVLTSDADENRAHAA
jgi:peptidoglycan/LPS O-acetylase OafA/YrhL